jgi:hypothetical protein
MVQETKSPIKISSGSVTWRDLIPDERVNADVNLAQEIKDTCRHGDVVLRVTTLLAELDVNPTTHTNTHLDTHKILTFVCGK